MNKNRLGSSDLWISEVGLGCMSLGTDMEFGTKLIHQAMDLGVNFLDTADLYDSGRNEEVVGEAIRGRRQDVVIATKVGNRRIPGREGWVWDPSKDYILNAVKESLRRLGTDYIDLYQLHGGTLDDPIDETIEAFEQLQKEGLIRYYGISSIRPNVIREYVSRSRIVSVMNQYSLLDRRAEEEVLPLLEKNGIGLIARGPLAGGRLAGTGETKVQDGYLDYSSEELKQVRLQLRELAGSPEDMGTIAIRYSLQHPAVAAAIPGASSVNQLLDNIRAAKRGTLTETEYSKLQSISKPNQYENHR
ncbi:oxidoreductase [Paenibacillus sp. CAA11]|uniref:aldo/keto reductase n=1 Tax=Paenibacillus sp. CAA11 TaxID=1532905 RepID=UPI000D3680AA|nr:aldo/keto reductase [Paenibacillus sp. CAA11]AWB44774.1 oxidoreductase [Paenibacillus sp. CAA11]